tara:strand:- start:607 stop:861 length:255 start_codon:yes stop_codon:yes gene_type:complete
MSDSIEMKIGAATRFLSVVAAVFLGVAGIQEWSARSSEMGSFNNETSSAVLALRAQGKLKMGLAIGFIALASAGVSFDENGNRN